MSLNLFVHGILALAMISLLTVSSFRRVLKNWAPKRQWVRFTVAGLLLVSIASVGLVFLVGPLPWQYTVSSVGFYILALSLGRWCRRTYH